MWMRKHQRVHVLFVLVVVKGQLTQTCLFKNVKKYLLVVIPSLEFMLGVFDFLGNSQDTVFCNLVVFDCFDVFDWFAWKRNTWEK